MRAAGKKSADGEASADASARAGVAAEGASAASARLVAREMWLRLLELMPKRRVDDAALCVRHAPFLPHGWVEYVSSERRECYYRRLINL